MAITQAMTTSFKVELLQGVHNFFNGSGGGSAGTGATFKIALYTSSASLGASTTAFTTTNEASGTAYTSGGNTLTNVTPSNPSGTTAITDFADLSFQNVTLTARGALIYNTTTDGGSSTTDAVAVLDFGGDKTATAGTFTIQFPAFTTSAAILRLA